MGYGATISSIQSDGKYFLNWDDGDESDRVKSANKIDGAVTSKVRDMVSRGTLRLAGSYLNDHFGDPVPKVQKVLIVDYIPAQRVTMGEYGGKNIPGVKKVISARYGSQSKTFDVTNQVTSMLRGDTLPLARFQLYGNEKMNDYFDAPPPKVEKVLTIEYMPVGGSRRRLTSASAPNCAEMELRNVISASKHRLATS